MLHALFVLVAASASCIAGATSSDDDFIMTSTTLPTSGRLMPEIGNGYFATVTRSNTVYLAGVFNGETGDSHRARIPAMHAFDVAAVAVSSTESYTLNMLDGYFEHTVESKSFSVTHRQYAHRKLTNLLVNEIKFVENEPNIHEAIVELRSLCPYVFSDDLLLKELTSPVDFTRLFAATTMTAEAAGFATQSVCFMYDVLPTEILFDHADSDKTFYFFMTVAASNDTQDCVKAYQEAVYAAGNGTLFASHQATWRALWESGSFRLFSNNPANRLIQAAISGQYYLFSSLDTDRNSKSGPNALSPGGLAHGAHNQDYQGHAFWDQETWMYPPILHLQSEWAARLLEYRVVRLGVAKLRANQTGYAGARFPWESAATGLEACPSSAPDEPKSELHVIGDIGLALKQQLLLTNDTTWYFSPVASTPYSPFDTQLEIARFWASRVTPVSDAGVLYYAILHAMPPDEYQNDVNNSVFTNKVASIALAAPYDCWTFARPNEPPSDELVMLKQMSDKLLILYDPVFNFHPEYDGYKIGQIVKQADAILIHYPLLHSGADAGYLTVRNDALFYERSTDNNGPGMSFMMFAVVWLSLSAMPNVSQSDLVENLANADRLMTRCLPFMKPPFNVHTENVDGGGAANLLTGYGGFLQGFINGFLGLRLLRDRLDFNPILPLDVTAMNFTNLDYRGSSFSIQVAADSSLVTVTQMGTPLQLFTYADGAYIPLKPQVPMKITNQRFAILTMSSGSGSARHVAPIQRKLQKVLRAPESAYFNDKIL